MNKQGIPESAQMWKKGAQEEEAVMGLLEELG